jgi:hypothetical protein
VRWIVANAIGEVLGLGLIGLVVGVLASRPFLGIPGWVVLPGVLLLGALEGVLVGTSQWLAMRRALPRLRAWEWIRATAVGALLAWVLGMLPSTLMDMGASADVSQTPPPEISEALRMLFAFVIGAVAGPILAGVQWRVLRRHVPRAGWWMPANSLAWALGMPLVFIAVGAAAGDGPLTLRGTVLGLVMLGAAGTVVGMIHGFALVQMLSRTAPRVAERPGAGRPRWLSFEFTTLGILDLFVGLNAVVAGALLAARPSGALLGMSRDVLRGSPFETFLIPGLVLALIVGGSLLLGGVLSLRRHALGEFVSLAGGVVLAGWISVQVALIGYLSLLQPIMFGSGLVIIAIGLVVMGQRERLRHG